MQSTEDLGDWARPRRDLFRLQVFVRGLALAILALCGCASPPAGTVRYHTGAFDAPTDAFVDSAERWVAVWSPRHGVDLIDFPAHTHGNPHISIEGGGMGECRGGSIICVRDYIELTAFDTATGDQVHREPLPADIKRGYSVHVMGPAQIRNSQYILVWGGGKPSSLWRWTLDRGFECTADHLGAARMMAWDKTRNELVLAGGTEIGSGAGPALYVVDGDSGVVLRSFGPALDLASVSSLAASSGHVWVTYFHDASVGQMDSVSGAVQAVIPFPGSARTQVGSSADGSVIVMGAQYRSSAGPEIEQLLLRWVEVTPSGIVEREERSFPIHAVLEGIVPIHRGDAVLLLGARTQDRLVVLRHGAEGGHR